MKVFVNCSNLTSGGGLTVGLGVLNAIFNSVTDNNFVIYVPNTAEYAGYVSSKKVKIITHKNDT